MAYFNVDKLTKKFLLDPEEATLLNKLLRLVVEDSCLVKCAPDEPIFVLRAHDVTSPDVVQFWLDNAVKLGLDPQSPKAMHARRWVETMREWQQGHGAKVPD